jgi:hypothetical protein
MNNWQPIETAPKDGSYVIVGKSTWRISWQASWGEHSLAKTTYGWSRFNSQGQDFLLPTHWQPLPEPPKIEDKDTECYKNGCPDCFPELTEKDGNK